MSRYDYGFLSETGILSTKYTQDSFYYFVERKKQEGKTCKLQSKFKMHSRIFLFKIAKDYV